LFFRISKGGKVQLSLTHGLNAASINYILEQREKQAGLKKRATPHDFRRTMISSFLDAGVDIATVQKIAGHENTSTTSKYDRRGEDAKRKAAEKVDLPDINGWTVPTPPTQKRTQKPTKNTRA
jgi:integrase